MVEILEYHLVRQCRNNMAKKYSMDVIKLYQESTKTEINLVIYP